MPFELWFCNTSLPKVQLTGSILHKRTALLRKTARQMGRFLRHDLGADGIEGGNRILGARDGAADDEL